MHVMCKAEKLYSWQNYPDQNQTEFGAEFQWSSAEYCRMPFPVPVAAEGCGSREKVFGYEVTELGLCVYGELGSLRLLCFSKCSVICNFVKAL